MLVACSGGPDSLALAAATAFVAPRRGLRAGAVVVDHGLQPGSTAVAQRAALQCRTLGLDPVVVRSVTVAGPGGPEGSARSARYAALEDEASARSAVAVLLGHTRDDQAETVLLGLARGSGARSLAGMPAVRGALRRPLLELPRSVVHAAAAQGAPDMDPWTDPTNADPALTRSRVRQAVLPTMERELGPGVVAALARSADMLRQDADALEALAADLAASALSVPAGGGVDVEVAALADAPAALRHRVLLLAARSAGCPPGDLRRGHVLEVDGLLGRWHGQGPLHLPGRVTVTRACGRLALRRTP